MQRYGDFGPVPTKKMISGREAYGAYTKFATETANLAITVAKSPFFLPYDDGYSVICNRQKCGRYGKPSHICRKLF